MSPGVRVVAQRAALWVVAAAALFCLVGGVAVVEWIASAGKPAENSTRIAGISRMRNTTRRAGRGTPGAGLRADGPPGEVLTPGEVAARRGCSVRTVYRAVEDGSLPHLYAVQGLRRTVGVPARAVDGWTPRPVGRPRRSPAPHGN